MYSLQRLIKSLLVAEMRFIKPGSSCAIMTKLKLRLTAEILSIEYKVF